jgi:serpin B
MRSVAVLLSVILAAAAQTRADEVSPAAESNNRFARALFGKIAAKESDNVAFSPYSISAALALTYAGAKGPTAAEMAKVLHWESDPHAALAGLRRSLTEAGQHEKVTLNVANALWGQEGEPFLPEFLGLLGRHHSGFLHRVDFANRTEKARRTINDWIGVRTEGRIPELIGPDLLTPDTSLVLTNAVYFLGTWQYPFHGNRTADRDFELASGERVKVPTMRCAALLRYAPHHLIELPYEGGRLAMVIECRKVLYEVEPTPEELDARLRAAKPQQVTLFLPRFETRCRFELARALAALGMKSAFGSGADFSGMNGKRNLFISAVQHEAFVRVDEKGTEAAAATAVAMRKGGRPSNQPVLRVDRPFRFWIRDIKTGAILFMGRIVDPRS